MKDSGGREVAVGDFIIFKRSGRAQFGIITELNEPCRVRLVKAVVKVDKKHRRIVVRSSRDTVNTSISSSFFLKINLEDFPELTVRTYYWEHLLRHYMIPAPPENFKDTMARRMPVIMRTWMEDLKAMRKLTIDPAWTRY